MSTTASGGNTGYSVLDLIRSYFVKYRALYILVSFGLFLVIGRIYLTMSLNFLFFFLNVFLALIPLWIVCTLTSLEKVVHKILFACMIVFLPNAPYLITDIKHFAVRPSMAYWYDGILITTFIVIGCMIRYVTIERIKHLSPLFRIRFHSLYFFLCFIVSIGIYIGRFLRFHSINILTNPQDIFMQTRTHMTLYGQQFWFYILFVTLFLWLLYYAFDEITNMKH